MKWLFIFAHPDDETVASGGTMALLAAAGHEIKVISTTDGGAGEISPACQAELLVHGSLQKLRRAEFEAACQQLGVKTCHFLDFKDGEITNHDVWHRLKILLKLEIESYRPDVVVTFDHSGWYFHLDHVGTSIATTLAVQESDFQVPAFIVTFLRLPNSKWKYGYAPMPITHQVDVTDVRQQKLTALALHKSQDTGVVDEYVASQTPHLELFQVLSQTTAGKKMLDQVKFFTPVE